MCFTFAVVVLAVVTGTQNTSDKNSEKENLVRICCGFWTIVCTFTNECKLFSFYLECFCSLK